MGGEFAHAWKALSAGQTGANDDNKPIGKMLLQQQFQLIKLQDCRPSLGVGTVRDALLHDRLIEGPVPGIEPTFKCPSGIDSDRPYMAAVRPSIQS